MPDENGPLAIVGMACHFPGADDLTGFWQLLVSGGDAIGPATGMRGDRRPGGYLDDVELFDAEFFGIAPREAAALDPQQRLLLELCWHAFEDARTPPRGGRTGVFVGCCSDEYALLSRASGTADPYTMTGTGRAFLANRISYQFGFTGPSLVVDTGQSSSLAALHQAVGSLQRGECTTAVVAGVQLNLTAGGDQVLAELGALSPTGRCHTFDARANGIVRGEGAGVVIVKPLRAAVADGDRVYCTILASALNNDGGGPGLTTPNQAAQQDLLREAYRRAGIAPAAVQYVELHGTGTPAGDPVEACALGSVFAPGRAADRPLLVGSVKTNIGHLEGAAGIAGLIKTAASLYHRELPPTLHHREPNPAIDVDGLRLQVCTRRRGWPTPDQPLVAGVSSFGLGGTNCHVVLGEAPRPAAGGGEDRTVPVLLSARDSAALRALATRFADQVAGTGTTRLVDIGFASATTRAPLPHRAAVVASGRDELVRRLRVLGDGAAGVVTGTERAGGMAYLFGRQGMQRLDVRRQLYKEFGAFARAFDEACAATEHVLAASIQDALWEHADLGDRTAYAQPALFALQVGLYRLLEDWGLVPDLLIGSGTGEIAAAHVAGVLSLADAAVLAVHRDRLLGGLPRDGAVISVEAGEDEVRALLDHEPDKAALAAVNGPLSVVVCGSPDALERISAHFRRSGRRSRRLPNETTAHPLAVRPIQEELHAIAAGLSWHRSTRPSLVSTVTGEPADPAEISTPEYWVRQLAATVRFGPAVRTAHDLGARFYVEIGPDRELSTRAAETVGHAAAMFAAPLAADHPALGVAETLGMAFVSGTSVDWPAVYGQRALPVDLPRYPFQRRRYWLDVRLAGEYRAPAEPVAEWSGDVTDLVIECTAAVLGYAPDADHDLDRTFTDLGLDSRMTVALRTAIADTTGRDLPTTLLFDYPTPAKLIEALDADYTP